MVTPFHAKAEVSFTAILLFFRKSVKQIMDLTDFEKFSLAREWGSFISESTFRRRRETLMY